MRGRWGRIGAAAAPLGVVWLATWAARTALFLRVPGTAWSNSLLPRSARVALAVEGGASALVVALLSAAGVSLLLSSSRPAILRRASQVAGAALLTATWLAYAASWAAFLDTGQFLDVAAWRFWMHDPGQNLEYALGMDPRAVVFALAGAGSAVVLVALLYSSVDRWRRRNQRAAFALTSASVALGLLAVLGVVSERLVLERAEAAGQRSINPVNGAETTWISEFLEGRRSSTDPVEHMVAVLADEYRSSWGGPAQRFRIVYPLAAGAAAAHATSRRAVGHRYNVIVILMESVRADQLRAYGSTREVMPAADSLARESRVYALVHSTASFTSYAAPSVLSSQYPLRSASFNTYPKDLAAPHEFLYDILKRAGYRTGFFSSDAERWGGKINYWHLQTLDRFEDAERIAGPRANKDDAWWTNHYMPALPDDSLTVQEAIQWMDSTADAPFFLYVALQDSHAPYSHPNSFAARFGVQAGKATPGAPPFRFTGITPENLQTERDEYANSLAYDDSQLARIIADLRKTHRWDNSVVVLTADHGEAFDEHGLAIHGNSVYEELLRIPLVIHAPGMAAGVDSTPASLIDVPPTVLGILGLPPDSAFQGADLRRASRCRPLYAVVQQPPAAEYAIVQAGWKLIYDARRDRYLLFDLRADPEERDDRARTAPLRRRDLTDALQTWYWAQLHYYNTLALRRLHYAPIISGPVATGEDAIRTGCGTQRVRNR